VAIDAMGTWTLDMDEQLVSILNERSSNLGIDASNIPPCMVEIYSTEKEMYKLISNMTQVNIFQ
jgi:hypothetical protein